MKIASLSIADYAEATEGMPHDVERLYFRMLLKMYSRESGIPDDDDDCARIFGYRDVRTYKALKAKLVAWPDAIEVRDGFIINGRAEKDIADYRAHKEKARENGKLGGRPKKDRTEIDARSDEDRREIDPRSKPDLELIPYATINENNYLEKPSPTPTPLIKKEPPTPLKGAVGAIEVLEAFNAYNDTALRCGLPQASKLTNDRKRKIGARLKEFGLTGWAAALVNIEKSSFLCGMTDQGFRADLDFLVQAKSFCKVHDGGYGNGRHAKIAAAKPPPIRIDPDEKARADREWHQRLVEQYGEH